MLPNTREPDANNVRSDLGLSMQPRFLHEVVIVPCEDGVIIDGTSELQVIHGGGVRKLLPRLVPLMDGRKTSKEIEAALADVPPSAIRDAIVSLRNYGLVEAGQCDDNLPSCSDLESVSFFRRYIGATRANASGVEAHRKLKMSNVIVLGRACDLERFEPLKRVLESSGVGWVNVADIDSFAWNEPDQTARLLVVFASFEDEDYDQASRLDDWCFKYDVPWLRLAIGREGAKIDVGPTFTRPNPCYRCFAESNQIRSDFKRSSENTSTADACFWSSFVAIEVVYFLTAIGPPADVRAFRRFESCNWTEKHLRWSRIPGCARCRPLGQNSEINTPGELSGPFANAAVIFEDYVRPPSFAVPTQTTATRQNPSASIPSAQTKSLLNCRRWALSRQIADLQAGIFDVLFTDIPVASSPLTADSLATILILSAGFRNAHSGGKSGQRWAASAGNLGSPEVYLIVCRSDVIAPGVYFYQAHDHSLARFRRRGALDVKDFSRRVAVWSSDALPDVVVVFTGAYHRLARKYGAFGYKLVNLDAGVAASQLQTVAKSLGISCRNAERWADDLVEQQLNLDRFNEHCTAVVGLSWGPRAQDREAPLPAKYPSPAKNTLDSRKYLSDFFELSVDDVTEVLYETSRVKEQELTSKSLKVPRQLSDAPAGRSSTVELPEHPKTGRAVASVLAGRISVRDFSPQYISLHQVSSMLQSAHRGDERDWPAEHREGLPLTFVTVAWRIDGLKSGVYVYQPRENALSFACAAPSPEVSRRLFVQSEFGLGAAAIWIVGNSAATCARHGDFGHRTLLLRAGAAGNRLWLAGIGSGLSGTLVAGLVADEARSHLGLDGYARTGLLAFVMGYRRDPSVPLPGPQARADGHE